MLGRDVGARRPRGLCVLELARLALADREAVGLSRLRTEDVKPPRLCEAVIRGVRGGIE